MTRLSRSAFVILVAVAVACSQQEQPDGAPSPTRTLQPSAVVSEAAPTNSPDVPAAPLPNVTASTGSASTGNDAIDALLAKIEGRDLDALVAAYVTRPVPCGIGEPYPDCPPGTVQNSYVEAFVTAGCMPKYVIDRSELRAPLEEALAGQRAPRLYAAIRSVRSGRPPPQPVPEGIPPAMQLLTTNDPPSPIAQAADWSVSQDGHLLHVSGQCSGDPFGAAYYGWLLSRFAGGSYIVSPRATCTPGIVDIVLDNARWTVFGGDDMILGEDESGRAPAVLLLPEEYVRDLSRAPAPRSATVTGSLRRFEDIAPGSTLRITGYRLDSCLVEAWTVEPA